MNFSDVFVINALHEELHRFIQLIILTGNDGYTVTLITPSTFDQAPLVFSRTFTTYSQSIVLTFARGQRLYSTTYRNKPTKKT